MKDFDIITIGESIPKIKSAWTRIEEHLSIVGFADRLKDAKDEFLIEALVEATIDQETRIKNIERKLKDGM